jgi:hypothetical protein
MPACSRHSALLWAVPGSAPSRAPITRKKELRFKAADGVWRVAFAFVPHRRAILLVCGNKSGGSEKWFYRELIRNADKRFDDYLARIRKEKR